MSTAVPIRILDTLDERDVDALAAVLADCVEGGASVSFMQPLTRERAAHFWRDVGADLKKGERVLLVAEDALGICGTVQLVFPTSENQPHRAEVAKLLVHRRARGRGIGEALMRAIERAALDHGRTLLVLDTASDAARHIYEQLGWVRLGDIPGYALLPAGGLCATTIYYRELSPTASTVSTS